MGYALVLLSVLAYRDADELVIVLPPDHHFSHVEVVTDPEAVFTQSGNVYRGVTPANDGHILGVTCTESICQMNEIEFKTHEWLDEDCSPPDYVLWSLLFVVLVVQVWLYGSAMARGWKK